MGNCKVVLGIGNPGQQYRNTRHNMGFQVLDAIAKRFKVTCWESRFEGMISKTTIAGRSVLLVKPMTYVNLSGNCARAMCRHLDIPTKSLLVISDDVSLPLAKLRMRSKGSSGSHRGLQSIIDSLNTSNFPRLRIGIGRDFSQDLKTFVLSEFTLEEKENLTEAIDISIKAVVTWVREGIVASMDQYN